jgi:hypothetical protein
MWSFEYIGTIDRNFFAIVFNEFTVSKFHFRPNVDFISEVDAEMLRSGKFDFFNINISSKWDISITMHDEILGESCVKKQEKFLEMKRKSYANMKSA